MKPSQFLALALAAALHASAQVKINGPDHTWLVEQDKRAGDVLPKPFLGRPAVWLRNNTHALLAGVEFRDGVIEFDLAPMPGAHFFALMFRRQGLPDHENIYFRPFQSGRFHAVQYAPRIRGSSTWQLYPEFNAFADLPENEWTHVRAVVAGSRLELFVGDMNKPTVVVPRLRAGPRAGRRWSVGPDQPGLEGLGSGRVQYPGDSRRAERARRARITRRRGPVGVASLEAAA